MGLDRWIQHSYPLPRVIKISQTGVPSSWKNSSAGMNNNNNSSNISHARISPTTTSSSSYNTASTDLQYSPSSYSTIQDDKFHPEYEEPENVYERPPDVVGKKNLLPKSPPPLPPPLNVPTLQKPSQKPLNPSKSTKPNKTYCGCKIGCLAAFFVIISFLFVITGIIFFLRTTQNIQQQNSLVTVTDAEKGIPESLEAVEMPSGNKLLPRPKVSGTTSDALITANTLLTYLMTKRKICLFEVSTLQSEKSRNEYLEEHIDQAKLLFFNNLSHSGVPVHPLQFQRYIRNMGVDHDCHIIVYDKGEQIWSSYAFWIFKLFGHEKVSLLNGGFPEWKRLQLSQAGPYPTALGSGPFLDYLGDFQARWTTDYISAFDDVLANFDNNVYDLVDAQSPEEFDGTVPGAIYGHIQGAINIPPEEVFDATNNTWLDNSQTAQIFVSTGLHDTRPVIVYCGTSLHASMLWFALHRLKYNAAIYFGSWPEWVIRAPDNLKVIPKQEEDNLLPTSKENLRVSSSNETFVTQKMKKQKQ